MNNKWPSSSKGYELISPLGLGFFGIVWKAKVLEGLNSGIFVALKKINLDKYAGDKLEEIKKNMILLNALDHPNLLNYKISFLSNNELWVVFEIMEVGSVEEIIKYQSPDGIKDMAIVASILKETLKGLIYLHENKQIHRDIKAGNILMQSDGNIVISDFGLTAKLKKKKKRSTIVGSPCWIAPEVLDEIVEGYDYKADIWSFGITAIELAVGKPPYSELSTMKVILKIVNDPPPKLNKEEGWDESFIELIECCLVKDPTKRKTSQELVKLKFFGKAKGKEYLKEKLLKNLLPLENRLPKEIKSIAKDELNRNNKNEKNKKIQWDFGINEEEEDFKASEIIQLKQEKIESKQFEVKPIELKKNISFEKTQEIPDIKKMKSVSISKKSGDKYSEFASFDEEEK